MKLIICALLCLSLAEDLPVDRARARLAAGDGRSAASTLEAALAANPGDRATILPLLRDAYAQAAEEAQEAGRAAEAESYRDDAAILARQPKTHTSPAASATPIHTPEPRAISSATPPEKPSASDIDVKPRDEARKPPFAVADAAFRAKRYEEAGKSYDVAERAGTLPETRRDAWAYCRWFSLVRRIKAGPADAAEWDAIHAEIEAVRAKSPKQWYGEYLRNYAAELSARRPAKPGPGKVVVRAADPDEPPSRAARDPKKVGRAGPRVEGWQQWETASFRIFHDDPGLAAEVAAAAEATRAEQSRRWLGSAPKEAWTPRCDIYLYPTAAAYAEQTGQAEDSEGFSTIGQDAGRVVARRVNLRADHPELRSHVLPHEVTHVVLADLFPDQPIPKWADEGIAVLAEPAGSQRRRVAPLADPLAAGKVFRLADLMKAADYPEPKYYGLFFAQSVSLTRYLVDIKGPAHFSKFLKAAQRNGLDPELKRHYGVDGAEELQRRWAAQAGPEATAAKAEVQRR